MTSNLQSRIKDRRRELGLSQEELAKASGVGQSTVANWERGGHIPRQATLSKIAAALDTDEIWLLSGEHSSHNRPINSYLSRPIRHVAVFDWPQNLQGFQSAQPRTYITVTADHENMFALNLTNDVPPFQEGTVLAFTNDYDATDGGTFLDITETNCALTQQHSPSSTARLIYSFTPH